METFLRLFIIADIAYMVFMLSRPAAARRKMKREKERQAAERQAKAETGKQEQAAAKASKPAPVAAQPPRKRGRPRKNPPKQAKPAAPVPAERPAPVPVEPKPVNNAPKTGAFAGEVVAFTGTCPKMERRYMVSHVNRLGRPGLRNHQHPLHAAGRRREPRQEPARQGRKMARPDDHLGGMVGTRFQLPGNHQAEARRR